MYEHGVDPGVGFNLVSWANFQNGSQVWQDAVQAAHDAGFTEVSLSPVRFYSIGTGSIASSSNQGPELSHVAAGVERAKSLGMRVTVNPFVEPVGFSEWRGFYDPAPGSPEATTFWGHYEDYLVDVAAMAEAGGADSMTVGTELRALSRNAGHNAKWTSVISAVDGAFSGTLGYAANWDNYNHPNVAAAIWDHPGIDFLGIDSYFQNLLSAEDAQQSGAYPDPNFISDVQSAWEAKLDAEILPYAASRKAGAGLPIEFTEIGYLPYDQTTATPQRDDTNPSVPGRQPPPLDRDEQTMAFEGFQRALDGRLAGGEVLAAHIWQWDMPGSSGSLWNMNPDGGNQPNNQQAAQWLSSFVHGTNVDPGDPDPDPPPAATTVLYSFEDGLEGFYYPDFETEPDSHLQTVAHAQATDGETVLAIIKPTQSWTWDARVNLGGQQLAALQEAVAGSSEDYLLELDVVYRAEDLPSGLAALDLHVAIDASPAGWNQINSAAPIAAGVDQTVRVEIPLTAFGLGDALNSAALNLGFAGSWPGAQEATIYIDRIALTDTAFMPIGDADFNRDGVIDAADYTVWRDTLGATGAGLAADGNRDGVVDAGDYELWRSSYGQAAAISPTHGSPAPEPATFTSLLLAVCAASLRADRFRQD
ncbi:glycoside hydrolase family 113 [Posidoniimonas corsicana]|uniref:glycoside hydrolase family 113 n=1 Tax=Posidoniimonas corsicana TaxID=1938618 RepID=UPI0011B657C4|nr:hypothetical protein [Posidoniimonas corsicana]